MTFVKGNTVVIGSVLDANCSDKLIEAIQRASKLFDSVMVAWYFTCSCYMYLQESIAPVVSDRKDGSLFMNMLR